MIFTASMLSGRWVCCAVGSPAYVHSGSSGGVGVRQDLERGLNPLVALPPRYLFGSALLCQAVALGIRLPALADIASGVLATAVAIGVVVLGVMLVDYTMAPLGSVA